MALYYAHNVPETSQHMIVTCQCRVILEMTHNDFRHAQTALFILVIPKFLGEMLGYFKNGDEY